jgi:hypothetical protein
MMVVPRLAAGCLDAAAAGAPVAAAAAAPETSANKMLPKTSS